MNHTCFLHISRRWPLDRFRVRSSACARVTWEATLLLLCEARALAFCLRLNHQPIAHH